MRRRGLEILQGIPIFGGIEDDHLRFLLERAPVVPVPRGDYFFREGDDGNSMFVLLSGQVVILKGWKEHDYVLKHLHPGDSFGEMALVDFCRRSASVLVERDASALELSAALLQELYVRDGKQFTMIHMNIAREVSRKLREADVQMFQARIAAPFLRGKYVLHDD